MKNEYDFIKKQSNKTLMNTLAKIRKEKANPEVYGKYGTSRWVTNTEFYGRKGIKALKEELARRKRLGLISKSAGVSKTTSRNVDLEKQLKGILGL